MLHDSLCNNNFATKRSAIEFRLMHTNTYCSNRSIGLRSRWRHFNRTLIPVDCIYAESAQCCLASAQGNVFETD